MPSKSKQQFKFIWALRNKYGTRKKAPKKMKWIFDEKWTKNVNYKDLPDKIKESKILNFRQFVDFQNF